MIVWEKREKRVRRILCPESGDCLRLIEEVIETSNVERRPTPRWAIERVIPKPVHDLDSLQAISEEDGLMLIVKDRELYAEFLRTTLQSEDEPTGRAGLSDKTIAQIRERILGIDPEYKDVE